MIEPRIGNLLIKDFRGLKGTVSIPFEAPIVLLHGSNGMGKTSILSALELALTGRIEHLLRVDESYGEHLLRSGASGGFIGVTNEKKTEKMPQSGRVILDRSGFSGKPLLSDDDAKFFGERCYLPQSVLGRLLELYQDASATDKSTQLTRFVNDLLGLDQLDALIDGLQPALNITSLRNLVPEFRRFENSRSELSESLRQTRRTESEEAERLQEDTSQCEALVRDLYDAEDPAQGLSKEPLRLMAYLRGDERAARVIETLTPARQELEGLRVRWQRLPKTASVKERSDRERAEKRARDDYAHWLETAGQQLSAVREKLIGIFPALPSPIAGDPEAFRQSALTWATTERERLDNLLRQSIAANKQLTDLDVTARQASARILEIDAELNKLSGDASGLAQALAGIAPHVHGDNCPVCSRNFAETRRGPLAAHLSASIAALTSQAARLRTLANARVEATGRISAMERQRSVLKRGELPQRQVTTATLRKATIDEAIRELTALSTTSAQGLRLLRERDATKDALTQLFGREQALEAIKEDLNRWTRELDATPAEQFASLADAIDSLIRKVDTQIRASHTKERKRQDLLTRLLDITSRLERQSRNNRQKIALEKRLAAFRIAEQKIDSTRNDAKKLSRAARDARAAIVGRVFNTSLNKAWRDLFVRLAPRELFVPAFKLPTERRRRAIEARLHTVHRVDGTEGGPPGTMLSAGNLNTAALTLFLALHLSVKKNLPWLILDDPVQSMDDVHISQFAALLRMISKEAQRQIVLAVHDRALFDYLVLELSPAFEGDRLIAVELSQTSDGTAIAAPEVLTYEKDKAIAA